MKIDTKAIKRRLNKAGYTRVSGWVRNADAPAIRAVIDATADGASKEREKP